MELLAVLQGYFLNVHVWKEGNCYKYFESKTGKSFQWCGNPLDGIKKFFDQLEDVADEISDYLNIAVVSSAVAAVIAWAGRIIAGAVAFLILP